MGTVVLVVVVGRSVIYSSRGVLSSTTLYRVTRVYGKHSLYGELQQSRVVALKLFVCPSVDYYSQSVVQWLQVVRGELCLQLFVSCAVLC